MVSGILAGLLQPRFLGNALDFIARGNVAAVYRTLALMLSATVLVGVLNWLQSYFSAKLNAAVNWRVKTDVFERLVRLRTSVYDSTHQGVLISKLEGDSGSVGALIIARLALVPEALRVCFVLLLVLRMSPLLTLLLVSSVPLMFLARNHFGTSLQRINLDLRRLLDRYISFVQESLAAYREIKSLRLESQRAAEFREYASTASATSVRMARVGALSGLANSLVGDIATVAVIAMATWQIMGGRLTVGELVTFTAYGSQLSWSLQNIVGFRQTFKQSMAQVSRVMELLAQPVEPPARESEALSSPLRGDVLFSGVYFSYDSRRPVLKSVSFRARSGVITGVAGCSGSGKTTLLNLLLRFYEPQRGRILLGGEDLGSLDLEVVRKAIAVVSQEPMFFTASVRDNLLLANPGAGIRQLQKCCDAAGASEFIRCLPDGLDTIVTDRGRNLSAGQRQRLALARALLQDSTVVLCDEITASLDSEAENVVIQGLRELCRTRTVIIVAHRPAVMELADTVVVLDKGRVVAEGAHQHLLAENSLYRGLYQHATIA